MPILTNIAQGFIISSMWDLKNPFYFILVIICENKQLLG